VRVGALFAIILVCAGCKAKTPHNKTFPFLQRFSSAPSEKTDLVKLEAEDGQWIMPAKNYASTRFSGLNQINAGNVKNLKVAWTFSTGSDRGEEAAPIVVNNTMYIVTPFPNHLYALDLTKPGAPLKWEYDPKPKPASQGVACCDVVNRGAVYWQGKIFFNTLDGDTIAVSADTGKPVWRTTLADINKGESITMAPLVVKGNVLVGNSGGEFGVRGWLTALDARTGELAWRAYATGRRGGPTRGSQRIPGRAGSDRERTLRPHDRRAVDPHLETAPVPVRAPAIS
jgi:lanthanide-dependent methanol dehydrogenase